MIRKVDGYKVISKTRGPLSKRPKSRAGAIRQLYAIEMTRGRKAGRRGKALRRLASGKIKRSLQGVC